ncbi:hypothetical protein KHP62_17385, partial [Rhodobacteraceae bacterium NNCM2]|nr:hypothetical protein [Coraliihabitans acroporae]
RFDMGASRFHELTLLEPDRETPSDCNPFYLFNLAETKPDTVLIELSETTEVGSSHVWWRPSYRSSYAKVVLRSSALAGADLWADPKFRRTAFFSDRLVRAIREEGITGVNFYPCRLEP